MRINALVKNLEKANIQHSCIFLSTEWTNLLAHSKSSFVRYHYLKYCFRSCFLLPLTLQPQLNSALGLLHFLALEQTLDPLDWFKNQSQYHQYISWLSNFRNLAGNGSWLFAESKPSKYRFWLRFPFCVRGDRCHLLRLLCAWLLYLRHVLIRLQPGRAFMWANLLFPVTWLLLFWYFGSPDHLL